MMALSDELAKVQCCKN